jgi:hypothetical protein
MPACAASRPQSAAARLTSSSARAGAAASRIRTGVASPCVDAAARQLAGEASGMVPQLDQWLLHFGLAMALVARLIEELSLGSDAPASATGEADSRPFSARRVRHEAPEQAVRSATERRLDSHVSLLRLVSQRLALASTQVQHTRVQATALSSLHQQLAASELEHRRLSAAGATSSSTEPLAAAERQALVAEVRALESAVASLTARLHDATAQPGPPLVQPLPPRPAPPPDMSELLRLQEVAKEEAYQRFEALRELEEARASVAAHTHQRRPQTADPTMGLQRRFATDQGRTLKESPWRERVEGQGLAGAERVWGGTCRAASGAMWPREQPRDLVGGGVALTGSPWGSDAQGEDGAAGSRISAWALETEALPLRPARAAPRRLRVAAGGTEELKRWW